MAGKRKIRLHIFWSSKTRRTPNINNRSFRRVLRILLYKICIEIAPFNEFHISPGVYN
jgi:hypothetical protein